jgi:SOUL heme-binding protein
MGERLVVVRSFSGWVNENNIENELGALVSAARADGLVPTHASAPAQDAAAAGAAAIPPPEEDMPVAAATIGVSWQVAQYNPPFTIPWLRRNEIWVHLDGVSEEDARRALTT